ncbi:hypothetical protein FCM35_KLT13296 [Carex littledalei]|uniref:Uncharacterized protein n=1 Tax=Carex littledalei TaxID=544730 RepID=A0A833VE05_9POAL|nr:hypothetical protein FCM35_KLT13296 [Carex littledalei]
MALDGSLVRCVKHPSHLSLGFCSLCLVERLSIVGLAKNNLNPISNSATPKLDEKKEKPKTTLLALFELDDLRNNTTKTEVESRGFSSETSLKDATVGMKLLKWRKNGVPVEKKEAHDKCSIESLRERQLRRSSSLRCPCQWIACCNSESPKNLNNWSKLWDGGTIFPLGLKRSLSESCKDRKLFGDQIAQKVDSANMRSQRVDPHKKKWMLGRSFSLRSASSCSHNKSNNGFVKFYLPSLKRSRNRGNDDNSVKKKRSFGIEFF